MNFFFFTNTPCVFSLQDKYRLQYGRYSGKAGDALTGVGGMVEQWSSCLNSMQFSTRDQVKKKKKLFYKKTFKLRPLAFIVHIMTFVND